MRAGSRATWPSHGGGATRSEMRSAASRPAKPEAGEIADGILAPAGSGAYHFLSQTTGGGPRVSRPHPIRFGLDARRRCKRERAGSREADRLTGLAAPATGHPPSPPPRRDAGLGGCSGIVQYPAASEREGMGLVDLGPIAPSSRPFSLNAGGLGERVGSSWGSVIQRIRSRFIKLGRCLACHGGLGRASTIRWEARRQRRRDGRTRSHVPTSRVSASAAHSKRAVPQQVSFFLIACMLLRLRYFPSGRTSSAGSIGGEGIIPGQSKGAPNRVSHGSLQRRPTAAVMGSWPCSPAPSAHVHTKRRRVHAPVCPLQAESGPRRAGASEATRMQPFCPSTRPVDSGRRQPSASCKSRHRPLVGGGAAVRGTMSFCMLSEHRETPISWQLAEERGAHAKTRASRQCRRRCLEPGAT